MGRFGSVSCRKCRTRQSSRRNPCVHVSPSYLPQCTQVYRVPTSSTHRRRVSPFSRRRYPLPASSVGYAGLWGSYLQRTQVYQVSTTSVRRYLMFLPPADAGISCFYLQCTQVYQGFFSLPPAYAGISGFYLQGTQVYQICTSRVCRYVMFLPPADAGISGFHLRRTQVYHVSTSSARRYKYRVLSSSVRRYNRKVPTQSVFRPIIWPYFVWLRQTAENVAPAAGMERVWPPDGVIRQRFALIKDDDSEGYSEVVPDIKP